MVDVYNNMGVIPRQSTTLHSHFDKLYSALKQGIRNLSLQEGCTKCPTSLVEGNESGDEYVDTLFELLTSDSKNFQPKKWWSPQVTGLLLGCHLEYNKPFRNGKQNAAWLENQKVAAKSKFEIDQKNWEDEIAHKRAVEEEERKEAAKNRKMVAESTAQLVSCLERLSGNNNRKDMDEKIQKIEEKMDDKLQTLDHKLGSLDSKFDSMLSVMQKMIEKNN
jgi:hypothetical protein